MRDDERIYEGRIPENSDTAAIEAGSFLHQIDASKPMEIIEPGDRTLEASQVKKFSHHGIYFKCNPSVQTQTPDEAKEVVIGNYIFSNDYILLGIIRTVCSQRDNFFTYPNELLNHFLVEKGSLFRLDLQRNNQLEWLISLHYICDVSLWKKKLPVPFTIPISGYS